MDALRAILLVLHVGGMAVLLAGFLLEVMSGNRRFSPVIFHTAGIQFLTGLALVGVNEADDRDLNHTKVAVKLLVALTVVGLTHALRKRDPLPPPAFFAAFGLAAANAIIAYSWT
ncbi:hypothetical protein [Sporichthya polymorpha]|uniref:hypothetical protein n=1 Tax=Sporichthya polymorpha TaxID=35751 RepID=UPI000373E833|nr:hypothetical protein [Sporichthya polymorpha]